MAHHRFPSSLLLMALPLLIGLGTTAFLGPPGEAKPLAVATPGAALAPESGRLASQTDAGIYRVYFDNRTQLADLARQFDIWEAHAKDGYVLLPLGAGEPDLLRAQGFRLELALGQTRQWQMGPPGYSCYRDVDALYATLQQMVASYPNLTELTDYGDSWRKIHGLPGYDLFVLRLSSSRLQAPKPRFFLMANIHGRELSTPETALHFVQHLLDGYGTDPDVTWILDYHEIFVVLTANPDGRQLVEGGCYQRKNRNDTAGSCSLCDPWGADHYGVDLNRNNPYHWGGAGIDPCGPTYQGVSAASEPETYYLNELLRSLISDQRPDDDITPAPDATSGLLVSLHSYGNLVLWPWGWTPDAAPNEARLQTLGRKFAYWSNYSPQQSNELYPTTGDTVDWAYGELGIPAYTFELGETFFQNCEDLPEIIGENLEALLYAAKTPRRPYITPSGPDALGLSVLPAGVLPGAQVQLTATIDDTQYSHANGQEPVQQIAAASYYVDVPPWITNTIPITHPLTAADASFDQPIEQVEGTVDTSDLSSGRHIVFVRGQDRDGNWGAFSAVFLDVARPAVTLYLPIFTLHSQLP